MWKGTANLLQKDGQRTTSERKATAQPHELAPITMPPCGRLTRKALAYEAQIAQLRAQGYTLNAIRQGLEAVGIHVSVSTIHREVRRASTHSAPAIPSESRASPAAPAEGPHAVARSAPDRTPCSAPSSFPSVVSQASGKDLAEAFALRRSDNPLVRAKELP